MTQRTGVVRRILLALIGWFVPVLGFVLAFGLYLSPWFGDQLDQLFDGTVRVEARIHSCDVRRNGFLRENTIRCRFSHVWNGQSFTSESIAWRSDSAFVTARSLDAALAAQQAQPSRQAVFRARRPQDARLADTRWLVMPSLGLLLFFGSVAVLALVIYLEPSATVYRRADLVTDPHTGELVEINGKRRTRMRRLGALKTVAGLLVVLSCLYGLSNRLGNAVVMMRMGPLQAVPAQLSNCLQKRHGGYRGHDQIDCGFDYTFNGQTLHGQAESLDFRNFPTKSRIDAEVARIQSAANAAAATGAFTAWVDPQRPAYAIAFISNDWWVTSSWGLWALELWIVLIAALLFLLLSARGAWRQRAAADKPF